jgi:hypothetical protein
VDQQNNGKKKVFGMRSSTQVTGNQSEIQWNESKTLLENNTYYIVHRNGPTVMNVRGETDDVYRVMIGSPHTCSCKKSTGFCVHILFVVLKVLRIPEDHPIAKKMSLTDSEIDFALSGNFGGRVKPTIIRKEKKMKEVSKSSTNSPEDTVERQPMDDENPDICPICQDDMTKDDPLTWCRKGCGNNIHAKCMKLYAQYKTTNSTNILCPLCREDWGPNAIQILNDDCKGRSSLKKACSTSQCHTCTFQIRGDLFRCVECSFKSYQQLLLNTSQATAAAATTAGVTPSIASTCNINERKINSKKLQTKIQPIDFCTRCFQNITREHARHHFISSNATELLTEFEWKHIKNPRAPQQLIDENILSTLQQRDLTDEDYDLLLGLDRKSDGIPLQKVLLDSLPTPPSVLQTETETIGKRLRSSCWCKNTSLDSLKIYLLPCGHHVHEQCISSLLDDAVSEGSWKLDDIHCGIPDCKVAVFRGISRRRFKVKKDEVNSEATAVGAAEKQSRQSQNPSTHPGGTSNLLLSGISGISIHGSSSATGPPPPAPLSTSTRLASQKIVRSSSRNFLQRQLEINQRQEDFANGDLAINQLHIGGGDVSVSQLTSQQQNRSRVPHQIRPPRNPTGKKKLLGLSANRMRSMTDDELCDDAADGDLNSSVLMDGIIPRASSVDRSMQQRSSEVQPAGERIERRNRIPIRKRSNGITNLVTVSSHQDSNDDTSLSLGGVGLCTGGPQVQNQSSSSTHPLDSTASQHSTASTTRQLTGKRIKSSPAGLLAARKKTEISMTEDLQLGFQRTSAHE